MGQKVHPNWHPPRYCTKDHTSIWYAERGDYADKLIEDLKVREFLCESAEERSCQVD